MHCSISDPSSSNVTKLPLHMPRADDQFIREDEREKRKREKNDFVV
jgi:hypothetical protein